MQERTAMLEPWQSERTVPADHPAFAGHFPGRPILPGVVLLDQAVLAAQQRFPAHRCRHIDQSKFLQPVGPGTRLHICFQPRPGPTGGELGLAFDIVRAADGSSVASGRLRLQALDPGR